MMSPFTRIMCCALGVAAAGGPLVVFTMPATQRPAAVVLNQTGQAGRAVPFQLRCSGQPLCVQIWHEGHLLSELEPQKGQAQGTLELPNLAKGMVLELELRATWPEDAEGAQGLTLELAPPQFSARQDTQWLEPGETELDNIYTFAW